MKLWTKLVGAALALALGASLVACGHNPPPPPMSPASTPASMPQNPGPATPAPAP
jgi:hypothetical protein